MHVLPIPGVVDLSQVLCEQVSCRFITSVRMCKINWRATGNEESADRAGLRTICPSDGGLPDVDIALASAIIADQGLYASLVRQADTAVAHR